MSALTISAPASLANLADQINQEHALHRQSLCTALEHARNAGELLLQAKANLNHGEWELWVRENCAFSVRTARTYKRIAHEWGRLEESATVAELGVKEALILLSEPEDLEPPVIEGELLEEPQKTSLCPFEAGSFATVTNPTNLFHGDTVTLLEKRGDIYVGLTSRGTEFPFLPGELELSEEPTPTPQPPNPTPRITEAAQLRDLLSRVYHAIARELPPHLAAEIEAKLNLTPNP